MLNALVRLGIAISLTFVALPAGARQIPTFRSVKIVLPTGGELYPDGPDVEAIDNNCLACHSIEMVLTQPMLSKATWTAEVSKMRNVYKAPVADEDIDAIVNYLISMKMGR
jgi:hypothetical protein